MVQIVVKIPDKEGEYQEWAIVELQGDLETRHPVPLSGKFIGDLHFTLKDAPILIIGHHILHGKVIPLEKPYAVITKASDESTTVTIEDMETNNDSTVLKSRDSNLPDKQTSQPTSKREVCYHVQAIIKKKILFKTRPKPIIAHVPKKL